MCIDCLVCNLPVYKYDVVVDHPGDTCVMTVTALCKVHARAVAINGGAEVTLISEIQQWPLAVQALCFVHMEPMRATEH